MKSVTLCQSRSFIALSILCALPMIASAEGRPYVGLEGGFNYENQQNLRTKPETGLSAGFSGGYIGGLTTGYAFSNGFRPELEFDYRRNDIDRFQTPTGGTGQVSGYSYATTGLGNIWYDYKAASGFFHYVHPYIGGGIGWQRVDIRNFYARGVKIRNDFDNGFAYQGGAGLGVDLTDHLTMSFDYRYLESTRGDFRQRFSSDYKARYRSSSALLGVRYLFGAPPVTRTPTPIPVPPVPVPVPVPVALVDSDGDGVYDNVDKCPGTPKGFAVDADGCIIEKTVVLRAVNFEFNSDRLTAPAKDTLDEVGAALIGQPTLNVQIGGHTDSIGSEAYNQMLSEMRAKSVKLYLISRGVSADTLTSKAFGETSPIATNDTEAGRTENRRVEFVVSNKLAAVKVVTEGSTEASKAAADTGDSKKGKKKKK